MVKTLLALCHGCDKEFGVEFYHEKAFRDLGSEFLFFDVVTWGRN